MESIAFYFYKCNIKPKYATQTLKTEKLDVLLIGFQALGFNIPKIDSRLMSVVEDKQVMTSREIPFYLQLWKNAF